MFVDWLLVLESKIIYDSTPFSDDNSNKLLLLLSFFVVNNPVLFSPFLPIPLKSKSSLYWLWSKSNSILFYSVLNTSIYYIDIICLVSLVCFDS